MAIIYSFPVKAQPESTDLVLITDKSSTNPADQTKQVTISSLATRLGGVSSFNTLVGDVTISAGTNITLNTVGNDIEIEAAGGGAGGTVTEVSALTIGTTGTDLSSTVADETTTPVITLQVPSASANNRGALTSSDWTTFNNKQANLVSGTNIKTINNTSLLGSGNITIASGGGPGTGTVGKLPYWDTTTTLADSMLSQAAGVPNVLEVDGSLELSSLYGLKFGAAGDAFNSYEEGVWTPTAYAPVGSAPTTANGAGTYTRIGDVVHITFTIDITSYSSLNVAMLIQGLPYNGLNGGASESSTISLSTNNGPFLQQRPTVGTLLGSAITMKRFTDMANNDNSLIDASWFAQAAFTNYTLTGSGTYKVA